MTDISFSSAFVQFLAVFVFGAITFFIASRWKPDRQQRSVELNNLGRRLGFEEFTPSRDEGFVMGWGFLNPLSCGDDRYAFNILRGTYQGQALFIFDHHYRVSKGNDDEDHFCTMFMLIEKQIFSQLVLNPVNLRDKIAASLGMGNEIKLESAEFSKIYCVRSQDKKFAYDVCNPQMMEFFLENRGLQFEINGPVISLAFEPQLPVNQIELNLQRLAQIRSLMPDYLFTQNA